MPRYCKAYKLEDLKKFPQWDEHVTSAGKEMEDSDLAYIQEDLTVTKNCLDLDNKEDWIYTEVTPEWEDYVTDELNFAIPDWEAESKAAREAALKAEEEAKQKEAEGDGDQGEEPPAAQSPQTAESA